MKYSLILFVSAAIALNLFTFVIMPAIADPLINEDQTDVSPPTDPCPTPEPTFQASAEEETPVPAEPPALETPAPIEEESPVLPVEEPVTEPMTETPIEIAPETTIPVDEVVETPVEPCITTTPPEEPITTVTETPVVAPVPAGEKLSDTVADVPEFVEAAPQVFLAGPVNVSFSVTGAPLSTLVFYRLGDATFSMSTGIGDDPVVMPRNFFTPGEYVIIDTLNPAGCSSMTLTQCRSASGYLGESSFKI